MIINFFKNNASILVVIVSILIILAIVFVLNLNKKDKHYFISIFNENRDVFVELSQSLMLHEQAIIYRENGSIKINRNKNIMEIDNIFDKKTVENIKLIMNKGKVKTIIKNKDYVDFAFRSRKDRYGVIYSLNIGDEDWFTEIDALGNNLYYYYIFSE